MRLKWLLSRKRSNLTLPDAVRLKVCAAIVRRGVTLVLNVTPLHSRDSSSLNVSPYPKGFKWWTISLRWGGLSVLFRTGVRNMGNFNFSLTHVLTFFHHVEQCCYPSFLINPHIPAMTSHVAYVIYATFTLITTQGLCNITISPYVFLSLCIVDCIFLCSLPFSFLFSYPCRLTHSV